MIVPLLVLTDEEAWLVSRICDLTAPDLAWRVLEPKLGTIPSEGVLVIATDAVEHPRLPAFLGAAVQRLGRSQCLLSIWGEHPDLRPVQADLPETVVYLPAEADDLRTWARAVHQPRALEDLTRYLRRDLPPALRYTLHTILVQSGNPLGPPPPHDVTALARALKLDRSNLSRRAKGKGVSLVAVLQYARARWVFGRARRPSDLPQIVRALGNASEKPLGRLLRSVADCTPSQAWRVDPNTMTGPLLQGLGDTVDFTDRVS